MHTYEWENFTHPNVLQLKTAFHLEDVVASGNNEFEKQVLLKDWVYRTLHHGNPEKDYAHGSALEILHDTEQGKYMYCTQYALTLLQSGIALGWYTRKLGVDRDHERHEKSFHHGVIDIWSGQWKKWYVIDALHNLHFEKNGIPLNALEIRMEYLKNKAVDIQGIIGNRKEVRAYKKESEGFDTPSNYFWFFISLRNNFFTRPGLYDTNALLWVDSYNQDKIWYKDGEKHAMYASQFIQTSNGDECFPLLH